MIDSETTLKSRLRWVKHYQESQNASLTCRLCGISKATLLKWWRRYQSQGELVLVSQSRRPHKTRERKVNRTRKPHSGNASYAPTRSQRPSA